MCSRKWIVPAWKPSLCSLLVPDGEIPLLWTVLVNPAPLSRTNPSIHMHIANIKTRYNEIYYQWRTEVKFFTWNLELLNTPLVRLPGITGQGPFKCSNPNPLNGFFFFCVAKNSAYRALLTCVNAIKLGTMKRSLRYLLEHMHERWTTISKNTCCSRTLLSPSNVDCTSNSALKIPTRLSVFKPWPPQASRHSW